MARKPAIQKDFSGNAIIEVEVRPNSSISGISGYNGWRDRLKITTKSLAINGEANKEVLRVIATLFELKRSQIKIISGIKKRHKKIKLSNIEIDTINKKILEIIEGE